MARALLAALLAALALGALGGQERRLDFGWDLSSLSSYGYLGPEDLSGDFSWSSTTTSSLTLAAASAPGTIRTSARANLEATVATGWAAASLWAEAAAGTLDGDLLLLPAYELGATVPEAVVGAKLRVAWVKVDAGWTSLTLGRQILSYGRGALWSPEDFLSGLETSGLATRKKGVDALRLKLPLGDTGLVDLVAKPRTDLGQGDYSLRLSGLALQGLDLGGLAARRGSAGAWLLGADAKLDLGPSFYAEATAQVPDSGSEVVYRAAAGLDWSLGDLVVALEYYHNGGVEASLDPYGLGAHNVYASVAWSASDRLSLSGYGTWAPGEGRGNLVALATLDAAQGSTIYVYALAAKVGSEASPSYLAQAGLGLGLSF